MFVLRERKRLRKRKARSTSVWMREMCRYRKSGHSATLIPMLRWSDPEYFFDYMRMRAATFDNLLSLVGHAIQKRNTNWRESIAVTTRLEITLRFLASGDSQRSLSYAFQVGRSTVSKIISETSLPICNILKGDYVKCPRTECAWKSVGRGFLQRWNVPNCIGRRGGRDGRGGAVAGGADSGPLVSIPSARSNALEYGEAALGIEIPGVHCMNEPTTVFDKLFQEFAVVFDGAWGATK
ncbi:uncharacterized protein LOC144173804 [Haemaphysalis longicornis]